MWLERVWQELVWLEFMSLELLASPLSYLLEPGKRLFWLFILSSLVIASIAVSLQQRRFDPRAQLRALCNRRYWFNRSTLVDIALLFSNNVLRAVCLLPLLGSHLAATIFVGSALQSGLGDAPSIALPFAIIGVLYTLSFFLCEDISRFGLHLLLHRVPWLWRFHRLHHSATNLTPLTVHRVHPLEMSLYYLRGLIVFGLVSGVFVYLFRNQVNGWMILGVDSLGFIFNLLGANLRHSPIPVTFGPLERWFISPAQHQVHHSNQHRHRDKNYGTCLAFWDRCYGSWYRGRSDQVLGFGLSEPEPVFSEDGKGSLAGIGKGSQSEYDHRDQTDRGIPAVG